jgi:hypothetical protein
MRNVHNAVDDLLEELDYPPLRRKIEHDPANPRRWIIEFRLDHVFGSLLMVEIMENDEGNAVGFVLARHRVTRELATDIMDLLMDCLDEDEVEDDDDASTISSQSWVSRPSRE